MVGWSDATRPSGLPGPRWPTRWPAPASSCSSPVSRGSASRPCWREVARDAASRGARVLRGVVLERGGRAAVLAWTQVLRGIGGWNPPRSARRAGCWPGRAGGEAESAQEAADARFRLFDAVATALRRLAGDAPLVVVARRPAVGRQPVACGCWSSSPLSWRRRAVLLLGAYRDTEAGDALHRMAAARAAARSAAAGRHRQPDDRRGGVPPVGRAGRGGVAALRRVTRSSSAS